MRDRLADRVADIIRRDPVRWPLLEIVDSLGLPDCWVGAGFIRNAVWDHLHGYAVSPPSGDIDVIWFGKDAPSPADRDIEARLIQAAPGFDWSVKTQALMHIRNRDRRYENTQDAMRFWPETATAVAVRRQPDNRCEVSAPPGLTDLFDGILRPTDRFVAEKRPIFDGRIAAKRWLQLYPKLQLAS